MEDLKNDNVEEKEVVTELNLEELSQDSSLELSSAPKVTIQW